MLKVLLAILGLALVVYALVDLWQVPADDVRGGSRALWTLFILILPVVGAVAWLTIGRRPAEVDRGPLPPDDDPDFLRGLRG